MVSAQNNVYRQILPHSDASVTERTVTVDTGGAGTSIFEIGLSPKVNTNTVGPAVVLAHSDSQSSGFSTLYAIAEVDLTNEGRTLFLQLDGKTTKRYVKVTVTPGTHTTNDVVGVHGTAIFSRLPVGPGSVSEMASGTNVTFVIVNPSVS